MSSKKLFLIGQTHRSKEVHTCSGHNCDFIHGTAIEQVPVLIFKDEDGKHWSLTFWVDEDECCSGWTTASTCGYLLKQEIVSFDEVPVKNGLYIYIQRDPKDQYNWVIGRKPNFTEADNDVFWYSYNGDDVYYPCGGYNIKVDFRKTARSMEKRPVWLFYGQSALGKSTLAHETNRAVYETDSSASLPDLSKYDIIVLGNKFKFTKDDIKKCLPEDVQLIEVNFS